MKAASETVRRMLREGARLDAEADPALWTHAEAALNNLVEQLEAYETALREIELASRNPDTAPGHFGYIARVVLPESNPAREADDAVS